jgi:hypothetical protein
MKFKLSDILESTVLTEGRKEDAMKKYGASKDLVDMLSAGDPSGNNKYLMWMVGQVMGQGGGDNIPLADAIVDAIERYHKQVNRLNTEMATEAGVGDRATKNPKDINSFSDVNELIKVVKVAEAKTTDKEIKKEADKIYEDENIMVYAPLTVRASCKYGSGTRWCITSKGGGGGYNSHFDSYSRDAVFYVITDKTTNQDRDSRQYKYSLQYYHNGKKTWWDAQDSSHNTPPSFMETPSGIKAMEAINAYHRSAVGEKLQREIRKYMLQPTSRGYSNYQDHLTPEQKTEAIAKIIREEGATVQVFESLIKDLSEKQKNSLLHNLTGLTNSSFNKVKDQLNNIQLINVIKNNPVVLNNSESIKYVDGKLTEDEKYNLAHSMDKSKVSNTDSKVILRRWSMTPEQRAQHNQFSQYVFLVDSNRGNVIDDNGIIKVDSLNPESYKIINGLKLKATMDRSLSMYAIKTEAELLDQYTGKKGSEISSDAVQGIMSKAKKI